MGCLQAVHLIFIPALNGLLVLWVYQHLRNSAAPNDWHQSHGSHKAGRISNYDLSQTRLRGDRAKHEVETRSRPHLRD